jgi:hypothetical protein
LKQEYESDEDETKETGVQFGSSKIVDINEMKKKK